MEQNPYQAPNAEVADVNRGYEYAGFWRRAAASLIDGILMSVITLPLLMMIYGDAYFDADQAALVQGGWDLIISYVLPIIVIIGFWVWKSATPGKMAMGVKIIDARTGGKPSTAKFIGRYFAYIPSSIVLGLGFLWVAFDKQKRGWHDMLAKTLVVKK